MSLDLIFLFLHYALRAHDSASALQMLFRITLHNKTSYLLSLVLSLHPQLRQSPAMPVLEAVSKKVAAVVESRLVFAAQDLPPLLQQAQCQAMHEALMGQVRHLLTVVLAPANRQVR